MNGLESYRAEVLRIAATYGASSVRVIGSGVDDDGDLDLLVDMDPGRSLFDLVDLGRELSELLGRRVDVLATATLSPRLRDKTLAEAWPL
jgi:predicted nucleotidyltransferase